MSYADTVKVPATEHDTRVASRTGSRREVWPVSSNRMMAVLTVCVAPEMRAAAPTAAYAPGTTDGAASASSSPTRRPTAAPITNSGMKRPHAMGSEMDTTVTANLSTMNSTRLKMRAGESHPPPSCPLPAPPASRSFSVARSLCRRYGVAYVSAPTTAAVAASSA